MSQASLYVDCPCCGARIEVRKEDGKLLQHWEKPKAAPGADPLKTAAARLKTEKAKREQFSLADAARKLDEDKRKTLEKFETEKKRVAEEGDTSRPPNPFDLD